MRALGLFALALLGACATGGPKAAQGPFSGVAPAALFDCLRERNLAIVAAHRGGEGAENALSTFARTLAEGPALLEVDVRRTADGALVLLHDETLERTTTGSGKVSERGFEEIALLRVKDASGVVLEEPPPTLEEALAFARGNTILQLDIKPGAVLEEVIAAVRSAKAEQTVVLIVYRQEDALAAHKAAPDLTLSVPFATPAEIDALAAAGVNLARVTAWLGLNAVNESLLSALAARGVESAFGFYRVERTGEGAYAAAAKGGVRIIATDRPAAAIAALREAGLGPEACLAKGGRALARQ